MNTTDDPNPKKIVDTLKNYSGLSFFQDLFQDSQDEIEQVCQLIGLNPVPTSVSALIAAMLKYNHALFAQSGLPVKDSPFDISVWHRCLPVDSGLDFECHCELIDIQAITIEFAIKTVEIQSSISSCVGGCDALGPHLSKARGLLFEYCRALRRRARRADIELLSKTAK